MVIPFLFDYEGPFSKKKKIWNYRPPNNFLKQPSIVDFIKDKKWMWYLASITLLIALPPILFIPILSEIKAIPIVFEMMNFVRDYTDIILLATFFFAIGLIYF